MIIEFIGSTGAGKTTLIAEVQRRLAQTTAVTTAFELIAAPLGLRRVTDPTAKNLIQELVGTPFLIGSLHRHKAFVSFSLRMWARQANFTLFTLNNLRSLWRKIGMYELIRCRARDKIVLVDEGTVLLVHNLFVYTDTFYTTEEIAKFATLIPLPDIIVYIRAPVDNLINRALQRPDPPREMKSKNRGLIEQYINRAVTVFEQVVKIEAIQKRILTVENPESTNRGCSTVADDIIKFIHTYESDRK